MSPKPKNGAGSLTGSILAKRVARLNAIQALFQMEASGQALDNAKSEFIERKYGTQLYEVENSCSRRQILPDAGGNGGRKPVQNRPDDEPRPLAQMAACLDRPDFAGAFQIGRARN